MKVHLLNLDDFNSFSKKLRAHDRKTVLTVWGVAQKKKMALVIRRVFGFGAQAMLMEPKDICVEDFKIKGKLMRSVLFSFVPKTNETFIFAENEVLAQIPGANGVIERRGEKVEKRGRKKLIKEFVPINFLET